MSDYDWSDQDVFLPGAHFPGSYLDGAFFPGAWKAAAGGDVRPDWVPADAVIYIEPRIIDGFATGRAWTEADGIVAIDTLLGSDPNTENGWDTTGYDAGNLATDGYDSSSLAVAFIGAARSAVLADATTTIRTKSSGNVTCDFAVLSASGDFAVYGSLYGSNHQLNYGSYNASQNLDGVANNGSGAINVEAFTITPTRLDAAVSGSEPISVVLTTDDYPVADDPIVAVYLQCSLGFIQSITIYDPLPDTAGLSALSETGVTNTAPTSLTVLAIEYWEPPFVGDDLISCTVPLSDIPSLDNRPFIDAFAVVDAEGNPTILSLVDDLNGHVSLSGIGAVFNNAGDHIAVGVHTFTLRATDPGGLYIEQEFTITVVAVLNVDGASDVTLSYDAAHYGSVTVINNTLLETLAFTALAIVDADLQISINAVLVSLDLADLETVGGNLNIANNALTTIALPSLVSVGSGLNCSNGIPALTTITFGSLKSIGGGVNFFGCALPEAQVDAILAMLVGLDGTGGTTLFENHDVDLSDGTNAPPSAAGLTSKATLEGRGCTVTVNS